MITEQEPQKASAEVEHVLHCSISEAARRLGLSDRTVRKRIAEGTLAAEHKGKKWMVILPSEFAETGGLEQNAAASIPPQSADLAGSESGTPESKPGSMEAHPRGPLAEIEQVIGRIGARHISDLRALSEEIRERAQATEPEHDPVLERPDVLEHPRDTLFIRTDDADSDVIEPAASAPQPESAELRHRVEAAEHEPKYSTTLLAPIPQPAQARLRPKNEALHERMRLWWQGHAPRLSYRTKLILVMCTVAVLIGVLMGLVILLLLSPARDWTGGMFISPIAAPVRMTSKSTALEGEQMTLSPLPPTPTARLPSSTATKPASEQPSASAVRGQATETEAASSPTLTPTAPASSPTPEEATPTTKPLSAADILRQVATAEAALRTGQFEARIDNGDGTGSSARVRFDLGDVTGVPRFHITSTYTGTKGTQTVERITIGDQSWERQPGSRWAIRPAHEGVVDQVGVFLPHAESIADAEITSELDTNVLRWHDAGRDVDMTLIVDPVTSVPRELRQVVRATGTVLTVTYSGWNTEVEITPPAGS